LISNREPRTSTVLAVWAYAIAGIGSAVRMTWSYWPGGVFHREASSALVALAWDFSRGDFYRPILGPLGYGGTRYMPLLFVAQGLLMRGHVDPIVAGVALMQISVLAASVGVFLALRASAVPIRLGLPLSVTPWATLI
jgi:hypothetical protein